MIRIFVHNSLFSPFRLISRPSEACSTACSRVTTCSFQKEKKEGVLSCVSPALRIARGGEKRGKDHIALGSVVLIDFLLARNYYTWDMMQPCYEALNDTHLWLLTVLRNLSKEDRMVCQSVWEHYFICIVKQTKAKLWYTFLPLISKYKCTSINSSSCIYDFFFIH